MRPLLIVLFLTTVGSAVAQEAPVDPIDDGRWIRQNGGEDALDAAMALPVPPSAVLAVLADSDAPERFLSRLAELAASDDPDVPARCLAAALAIGERLRASDLSARESSVDAGVLTAFEALASREHLRPDLRAAASALVAKLRAIQPASEP